MAQMTKDMKDNQGGFNGQMFNTEMCTFHRAGVCTRGSSCSFAHDIQSLRKRPNLSKTQLCKAFMKTGVCVKGGFCNFAHGKEEQLRRTCKTALSWNAMPMTKSMATKTQGHEMPKSSGTVISAPPRPPTRRLKCQPLHDVHYAAPLVPFASLSFSDWQQQLMVCNNHEKCVDMEKSVDASKSTDANSDMTMPSDRQPSEESTPVSQLAAFPLQDAPSWEDFGVSVKNTFIDGFMEASAHASEQHLRRCTSAPSIC